MTSPARYAAVLLAVTLGAALRLPGLGSVPPRWDEGWSLAHASLTLAEVFAITRRCTTCCLAHGRRSQGPTCLWRARFR